MLATAISNLIFRHLKREAFSHSLGKCYAVSERLRFGIGTCNLTQISFLCSSTIRIRRHLRRASFISTVTSNHPAKTKVISLKAKHWLLWRSRKCKKCEESVQVCMYRPVRPEIFPGTNIQTSHANARSVTVSNGCNQITPSAEVMSAFGNSFFPYPCDGRLKASQVVSYSSQQLWAKKTNRKQSIWELLK